MADAFPPIYLYALLAATAGLLAGQRKKDGVWRTAWGKSLSCAPFFLAWVHIAGYIGFDLYRWHISCRGSGPVPGEVRNLALHASILVLFLVVAMTAHVKAVSKQAIETPVSEDFRSRSNQPRESAKQ